MILLVEDEQRRLAVTFASTTSSVDALHGRNHSDDEEVMRMRDVREEVYWQRADEDIPANFTPRYMEDSTNIPEVQDDKGRSQAFVP